MRPPLWQQAASFAARCHEHQYRDDGETPYFSHPARVAMIVAQLFGCTDEAAIAVAFLHDTIENSDLGYDDLKADFGTDVAAMVVALTKNKMLSDAEGERDYLDRLARADWRVRLIKLADQYDNYADTLTGLKHGSARQRQKAKMIITLATPDVPKHAPTRRAVGLLTALIKIKSKSKSR